MSKTVWLCSFLTAALMLSRAGMGWAEVKPGNIITKDNIAQAADLLTPTTRWMVERGVPIQVIETKPVPWPKAYRGATEKYAGQVKLAADGRDLYSYVAGCPFPNIDINDPLAGFRVMWNHEQSPAKVDNVGVDALAESVSSRGEVERTHEFPWRRLMWAGRLYIDPKPVIPHSPPLRYTNLYGPFSAPNDLKGLMLLDIRYLAQNLPDDTYMMLPELRRIRRLTEANRSDSCPVRLFDFDSFQGFNGNIRHWTFHVLAEKEILGVVHSGKYGDREAWCAPRDGKHGILAALPCVAWEKRRVWVIEGVPTEYPRAYRSSKRIMYIDQEFFAPLVQEIYDQNGELWRILLDAIFYDKKPYDEYPASPLKGGGYNYTDEWPFTPNWVMVDIQRGDASAYDAPSSYKKPAEWRQEWYFNENVVSNRPEVYTPYYLIQSAR